MVPPKPKGFTQWGCSLISLVVRLETFCTSTVELAVLLVSNVFLVVAWSNDSPCVAMQLANATAGGDSKSFGGPDSSKKIM